MSSSSMASVACSSAPVPTGPWTRSGWGWNDVIQRDRRDMHPVQLNCLPRLERHQAEKRFIFLRQSNKIGPDAIIEEIGTEAVERLTAGVDVDAVGAAFVSIFEKDRQAGDVIEMTMRQQNVAHAGLFFRCAMPSQTTGVQSDGVVQQSAGEILQVRPGLVASRSGGIRAARVIGTEAEGLCRGLEVGWIRGHGPLFSGGGRRCRVRATRPARRFRGSTARVRRSRRKPRRFWWLWDARRGRMTRGWIR